MTGKEKLWRRCIGLIALPMAHPSALAGRLKSILQPKRRQMMVTRKMLTLALLVMMAVVVPLAALRPVGAANPLQEVSSTLHGEVIVIDAGHGAQDSGWVAANGVTEKVLNLQIAQRLRSLLENRGAVVYMTRDGDTYLNIRDRSRFAAEKHANCLISIHCEGEKPSGRSGAEVYYHADERPGHRLAEAISLKVDQTTHCPGHVLSDSTRFIQGFGMLRGAPMPAVLVMCGFMASSRDLARLRDPQGQQQIAEGIAQGLTTFLGRA